MANIAMFDSAATKGICTAKKKNKNPNNSSLTKKIYRNKKTKTTAATMLYWLPIGNT